MTSNKFLLAAIPFALSIFVGGYYIGSLKTLTSNGDVCSNDYSFVSSRLECRPPNVIKKQEYTVFSQDLQEYVDQQKQASSASHISVYFRDLQYGPTFGIESQERFVPASLLKIPVLILYLSLAEKDPTFLSKSISFTNDSTDNLTQETQESIPLLVQNRSYSIESLLERMSIYSDNLSYILLTEYLARLYPNENLLQQTIIDLGLVDPRTLNEDSITVKAYSSLFIQLYNGTYLSPQMSEKALSFLSKSTFKKGLVAGVPQNITVSHKFGERTNLESGENQLHDCGIVYYPGNPYLLCVMTRGSSLKNLQEIISSISQKVYKEVDSRKLK